VAAGAALGKTCGRWTILPFAPGRGAPPRHVGETKHRFVALSTTTPRVKELIKLAESKWFTGAAAPCPLSWAAWTLCRQTDPVRRRSNAERLLL